MNQFELIRIHQYHIVKKTVKILDLVILSQKEFFGELKQFLMIKENMMLNVRVRVANYMLLIFKLL